MAGVDVQVILPGGVIDTMVFGLGANVEDVEDKIREAVNMIGGTLELNGITCLKGQTLGSIGVYTFNRGIPQAAENSRKRGFEDISSSSVEAVPTNNALDSMRRYIDQLLGNEELSQKKLQEKGGSKASRPDNWRAIAEHAVVNGNQTAMTAFPEVCVDKFGARCKTATIEMRLMRWIKDYNIELKTNSSIVLNHGGRKPVYGDEIDARLLAVVQERIAKDEPVDATALHDLLVAELAKDGLTGLLREEGGTCTFGVSWAQRFFNRHNLRFRSTPLKRARQAVDGDEKVFQFENQLAVAASDHRVPPALVFTMDEIPFVFSPSASRIRATKHTAAGQLVGITKDKTQVTTTLCVNERGDILPPQMIFGGSTDRCHPKDEAPMGGLYCHTNTHWQAPETMIHWIDAIFAPFKNATIAMEGLPEDQHCILICDLHFSHKEAAVLQHFQANNIIPVYLPSGYAEDLQPIELVCKTPFQHAAKSRFRQFLHEMLTVHVEQGKPVAEFVLNFNVGFLKPFVPKCVEDGMAALQTESMRTTIANSFAKHVGMERCRTEARIATARASWVERTVPTEVEGDPVVAMDDDSEDD